jgi:ornithine cyclodeaminase/alanine dehydrogenase-like protein (mu-crystallin family)
VSKDNLERLRFAGANLTIVREEEVLEHLSIDDAIADLRTALEELRQERAVNCARIRLESSKKSPENIAWVHTLRARMDRWGIAGGKDYTSIKFETPAMWATVVDTKTGLPVALLEANYLSRVRTAATAAVATDLLAPKDVQRLAHFGAGKISELLVQAVLKVRPSINQVLLVRSHIELGAPTWLDQLGDGVLSELVDSRHALSEADIVTTATSGPELAIPEGASMPAVRHINLMGSNHHKRQEIPEELARRCLPPSGYLVIEDRAQAAAEAGDFLSLAESRELVWSDIPTLDRLMLDSESEKAARASLTAFKSVGMGLMDLAVSAGVLRRLGLLAAG